MTRVVASQDFGKMIRDIDPNWGIISVKCKNRSIPGGLYIGPYEERDHGNMRSLVLTEKRFVCPNILHNTFISVVEAQGYGIEELGSSELPDFTKYFLRLKK